MVRDVKVRGNLPRVFVTFLTWEAYSCFMGATPRPSFLAFTWLGVRPPLISDSL